MPLLNIPSPLLLGDGSATAPTYSYAGEPATGWYRSSSNTQSLTIQGTQRCVWDSNGPSVGGSTPAYRLGSTAATPDVTLQRLAAGSLALLGTVSASANRGSLSLGTAATAFDGATAGFFVGSANGTWLAINTASGFNGNLFHFSLAGVTVAKLSTNVMDMTGTFRATLGFNLGSNGATFSSAAGAIFAMLPGGVSNGTSATFNAALFPGSAEASALTLTPTQGTNVAASFTNLRLYRFHAPTINADGTPRTLTNGAHIYIDGPIVAGTNLTITNNYAFWVDAGASRFDGRLLRAQGADVASANDLTLGDDGNTFEITGATQINAITTAGWQAGSEITLIFASTPTLKHSTAGGAGTAILVLAGSVDFVATAGSILSLCYMEQGGSTFWRETGRTLF